VKKFFEVFIFGLVFLVLIAPAYGQLVPDFFTRTSGPESFFADARTDGYTVSSTYSGFVEVIVSGSWSSISGHWIDSWYEYIYNNIPINPPTYWWYAMTAGFNGCAWWIECGGRHLRNWTVFIEGVGFMSDGFPSIPPYNSLHEYHFVVDFGSNEVQPTIGIGDGGYWDNDGGLNVTLYRVVRNAPTSTNEVTWGQIKSLFK